jgi:hypothetical protein
LIWIVRKRYLELSAHRAPSLVLTLLYQQITTLKITLHGSLAATGKGHMTPEAILMGLEGDEPDTSPFLTYSLLLLLALPKIGADVYLVSSLL